MWTPKVFAARWSWWRRTPTSAPTPAARAARWADRIDGLIVSVVAEGEPAYGCENDDLPLTVDEFGWDYVRWTSHGSATYFLAGDVRAQAERLAARYDSDVARARVDREPRTFRVPVWRYGVAAGLVVLVVGGVVLLNRGLDRSVLSLTRVRARRAAWRARRSEVDCALGEVALIMVELPPGHGGDFAVEPERLAEDYLTTLAEWEGVGPG